MLTPPAVGALIKLHESTNDWRDHGDSEPIYNGNMLEWWTGTGWQLVGYQSAGRATAFLVLEDDTTHMLDHATRWFRWVRKGICIQTRWIRTRYACTVLYVSSTIHTLSL